MGRYTRWMVEDKAVAGGVQFTLACADRLARALHRRRPEARALAAWLDAHRDKLGLPESDDFCPSRNSPLLAANWRRARLAVARSLRAFTDASQSQPAGQCWVDALAAALGLSAVEQGVLSLALHYRLDNCMRDLVHTLNRVAGGRSDLNANAFLLAQLLAGAPAEVEAALAADGPLLGSGLLRMDGDGDLEVLGQLLALVRRSVQPGDDPFTQLLGPGLPARLPPDAFGHLGPVAGVAASVLRAAVAGRELGVNILLHGPPGTGKTSFAATLAAQAGAWLRAVTEQDEYGAEPNRAERLAGLRLAQRLAASDTVLLFDEAEDAFVAAGPGVRGQTDTSRVFMHRLLERTPVPVIWTANDISALGPAVLRRMTLCVEMQVPSLPVRTRLWRELGAAEGVPLAEPEAARLARLVPAAPAVAATALRATRLAGGDARTVQLVVGGLAHAISGGRPAPLVADRPALYDPALVNADTDLDALADRLCRPGTPPGVSLLLSGPPGTGKSAWVRYLAGRMRLEVLEKRGSDLFGPFVGQTEAAIARAFAEARAGGTFLIFDEADSLLADRAGAVRSWEVSQVNEMLTWMESHPLPFACTTNLLERLDRASLRRFLVKVVLDWLSPGQARLAFQRFFDLPPPPGLDDLRTLAPADFALVRRRAELIGVAGDPAALLDLLAAECAERPGGRVRIGFGAGVDR